MPFNSSGVEYETFPGVQAAIPLETVAEELTPYHFGAVPPVPGSDNTNALFALFSAASGATYPSGASIYLPPGLWRYNGSVGLPLATNLVIRGAGRRTRLASIGPNLFEWNTVVSGVNFENLWLESAVAGKSIFAPGAAGGIFSSTFKRCYMLASTTTSQIWNQTNASSFIGNSFGDCELERAIGSTVVPFSIINSGGAANFNRFDNVRFNGNGNLNTPFMHIESTLIASYLTDWVFTSILGEQNTAGMIQTLAAYNWKIIDMTDEDSTVAYVANIIDFRANGLALGSRGINIENSGRRGQSMTGGTFDISVDPATSTEVTIINCNPTPTSQSSLLNIPVNSVILGTRGYPTIFNGTGAPAIGAVVGSLYLRLDGGANTTLYVKESGTGGAGWVAK